MALFIIFPFSAFYVGTQYGKIASTTTQEVTPTKVSTTPSLLKMAVENDKFLTDTWQSYTNTKVGFTFKYPSTLNKLQEPGGPINPRVFLSTTTDGATGINDGFEFSFFPFSGTIDELQTKRNGPDSLTKAYGTVEFNGITGKWYGLRVNNYLRAGTEIHFVAKNHGFIIRVTDNNMNSEKGLNLYELEQLLSTFQLTN